MFFFLRNTLKYSFFCAVIRTVNLARGAPECAAVAKFRNFVHYFFNTEITVPSRFQWRKSSVLFAERCRSAGAWFGAWYRGNLLKTGHGFRLKCTVIIKMTSCGITQNMDYKAWHCLFVCFPGVTTLFGCIFHSPLAGFSFLILEVSWSHTTTRHSR